MAMLPQEKSAVLQMVIKLKSTQSLEKGAKGVPFQTTADEERTGTGSKQFLEYIVLQRMILEGNEKPWMIWGTTQETKAEDIFEEEKLNRSTSMGSV